MSITRAWVEDGVDIHDHFDGSAHCVQCGGECRLKGEKRLLTEMIRWSFERWVRGMDAGMPDMLQRQSLAKHGVRIEECYNRASAAMRAVK